MVLAQRLVRKICYKCRQTYEPPRTLRRALERMGYEMSELHRGVGCRNCRNTGYSGRIGIHELLVMSDELRDQITSAAPLRTLRETAAKQGLITLRHDGFRKVREGITTVEEIFHVSGDARETTGEVDVSFLTPNPFAPSSMPIYQYPRRDSLGHVVRGELEAEAAEDASLQIRAATGWR